MILAKNKQTGQQITFSNPQVFRLAQKFGSFEIVNGNFDPVKTKSIEDIKVEIIEPDSDNDNDMFDTTQISVRDFKAAIDVWTQDELLAFAEDPSKTKSKIAKEILKTKYNLIV